MKDSTTNKLAMKNHVSGKAGRLNQVLKTKFGLSVDDFNSAIRGDLKAAERIGQAARDGQLAQELAPKLGEAMVQAIQGTEAYNRAIADVLAQSAKSGIAIDKSVMQTTLAGQKYQHERTELAQQFVVARSAENTRHQHQLNYSQIKAYVDSFVTSVDNKTAILEQSLRPEIKQIQADESHQRKTINEALGRGDDARYDLIPAKDYTTGIKETLLKVKSALGF